MFFASSDVNRTSVLRLSVRFWCQLA